MKPQRLINSKSEESFFQTESWQDPDQRVPIYSSSLLSPLSPPSTLWHPFETEMLPARTSCLGKVKTFLENWPSISTLAGLFAVVGGALIARSKFFLFPGGSIICNVGSNIFILVSDFRLENSVRDTILALEVIDEQRQKPWGRLKYALSITVFTFLQTNVLAGVVAMAEITKESLLKIDPNASIGMQILYGSFGGAASFFTRFGAASRIIVKLLGDDEQKKRLNHRLYDNNGREKIMPQELTELEKTADRYGKVLTYFLMGISIFGCWLRMYSLKLGRGLTGDSDREHFSYVEYAVFCTLATVQGGYFYFTIDNAAGLTVRFYNRFSRLLEEVLGPINLESSCLRITKLGRFLFINGIPLLSLSLLVGMGYGGSGGLEESFIDTQTISIGDFEAPAWALVVMPELIRLFFTFVNTIPGVKFGSENCELYLHKRQAERGSGFRHRESVCDKLSPKRFCQWLCSFWKGQPHEETPLIDAPYVELSRMTPSRSFTRSWSRDFT